MQRIFKNRAEFELRTIQLMIKFILNLTESYIDTS